MEGQKNNTDNWIIRAALIFLLFVFLLRFMGRLFPFILGTLLVLAIGGGAFFLWDYLQKRRRLKARRSTVEGMSEERIEFCREQIQKNKEEARQIQKSIKELKGQMATGEGLANKTREDAIRLIREFELELKLRQSKISFFETALHKLEVLQHNRLLTQSISDKELELKRLKEGHYEDLANMEELRSDVEMETLYLDTIDELSLKLNSSTSLENAESLRKELEEMTRELGGRGQ
ncbi:MAG: 5-bromo-4-chloroindolyl phosphate hydrolysis family protein [Lewinellaceae bacterium]|nr:5-bromo-4-chloroindolyl phosphate hydrolysis family protein [Lewinellaceae bacterium]